MMSPTVGDWHLRHTQNKALLFSYCWADRAAIGMGGHGSFFKGNKKPWIFYFIRSRTASRRIRTTTSCRLT